MFLEDYIKWKYVNKDVFSKMLQMVSVNRHYVYVVVLLGIDIWIELVKYCYEIWLRRSRVAVVVFIMT